LPNHGGWRDGLTGKTIEKKRKKKEKTQQVNNTISRQRKKNHDRDFTRSKKNPTSSPPSSDKGDTPEKQVRTSWKKEKTQKGNSSEKITIS